MAELALEFKESGLTGQIIKAYYVVYNYLGYGFLERVYENAMALELAAHGLQVVQQAPIQVYYGGHVTGDYYADLLVSQRIICELKAARKLAPEHEAQLLNYLKATPYEVGLLFNFGLEPEFKRKILDNHRKGSLSWTTGGGA